MSNRQILENAKKVAASGKPYLVRTPVIPGVNDTEEEIGSIANYVGTWEALNIMSFCCSIPWERASMTPCRWTIHLPGPAPLERKAQHA